MKPIYHCPECGSTDIDIWNSATTHYSQSPKGEMVLQETQDEEVIDIRCNSCEHEEEDGDFDRWTKQ